MIPRRAQPPERTRVLLALIRVHHQHGRATLDDVATEVGRSRSTVYAHLRELRRLRFVTWDQGRSATFRPLLRVVATEVTS